MEFVKRENEIMLTLNRFVEEELDFVVVGGYAVSGLGVHRFSVDCDVIIPKSEVGEAEEFLQRQGFKRNVEKTGFDETYAGKFLSYKKKVGELLVTFDLLVGSLVCRTTGAAWSFDYVKKYSVEAAIAGIEVVANCRIPEKELMIAFKIHSARRTDVRDIVMLMENTDLEKVLSHFKRGKTELLKTQVSNIMGMLNDVKLVDSLKGVFRLTVDVKKQIEGARRSMESLLRRLS